jgi:pimeloyl-ACP methyl ester carboxylesterase
MRGRALLVMLAAVLVTAPHAHGQDATGYCTPDGGPQGQATDAEHNVLLGDPPLPAGVRESRISVNGISTRVHQAGPAWAEDAVVFLHGNPDSSRDYDDLMAASGRFTRAVSFDFPGFGKSDKAAPPEVHTTDGAARHVQDVLDQLNVKRAVLVGHDFGGVWGLQWAVGHQGALRGAVLIAGGVFIDSAPHPDAVAYATPGVGEQEMAGTTRQVFVGRIKQANPLVPEDYLHRRYDDFDRPMRCAVLRYYRSAAETFQTLGREQAAALKPLDRPALVLWGEKDPYVSVDQAEKQKEAFPSARVVTFAEHGHWPHIESPERARGEIVPFLEPDLGFGRVSGARSGSRGVRVRLTVGGVLPAHRVAVRLDRGRKRLGASRRVRFVDQAGSLPIRLNRPLRAGRHTLTISARGLPRERLAIRVR